jgi:HAD superfamily hydrolase (TIGR01509 family)
LDQASKTCRPIRAVLFDFDGTLTRPGDLDFAVIRQALQCPPDRPVLEFIATLPDATQRRRALEILDRFEMEAAERSQPNGGAEALLAYLRAKGLAVGIISRNSRRSIARALEGFNGFGLDDFDVVISRDDPPAPKPDPAGVIEAAARLGIPAEETLVVGDFVFDIQAGAAAGAQTAYLENVQKPLPPETACDYRVQDLQAIGHIVRMGRPLPAGKLPSELLEAFLEEFRFDDPAVLINPGIGEDTAAIDMAGEAVLVLKSDPITFATDAIGHYAVLVNANDIATAGARPRWLLTTLLFPVGTTGARIHQVIGDLQRVCHRWQITLCGGHTEITEAVTRPVISGMLAGTVPRDRLIDKRRMRQGDIVLLTKGVAVEGTAIIAREFGTRLHLLGMTSERIDRCRAFLERIGILDEARVAAGFAGVSGMHDVTEGGLATALEELSAAGGHRLRIDADRIPIFAETAAIGRLLGIDPLGLIGSGSLLIACRPEEAEALMSAVRAIGVQITRIGELLGPGRGVEARTAGGPAKWPRFEVDEITRLF